MKSDVEVEMMSRVEKEKGDGTRFWSRALEKGSKSGETNNFLERGWGGIISKQNIYPWLKVLLSKKISC